MMIANIAQAAVKHQAYTEYKAGVEVAILAMHDIFKNGDVHKKYIQ